MESSVHTASSNAPQIATNAIAPNVPGGSREIEDLPHPPSTDLCATEIGNAVRNRSLKTRTWKGMGDFCVAEKSKTSIVLKKCSFQKRPPKCVGWKL
eukprot:2552340-Amphidinium_carterae.1